MIKTAAKEKVNSLLIIKNYCVVQLSLFKQQTMTPLKLAYRCINYLA